MTLRARWNAIILTAGVFLGLVVLGLLGTVTGMIEASSAIAAAPPDTRSKLLFQALAITLATTAFLLIFLVMLAPPAFIAATVRAAARAKAEPT